MTATVPQLDVSYDTKGIMAATLFADKIIFAMPMHR